MEFISFLNALSGIFLIGLGALTLVVFGLMIADELCQGLNKWLAKHAK